MTIDALQHSRLRPLQWSNSNFIGLFWKRLEDRRPFALGGAFAWATYRGYLSNTKDIDLYVPESKKEIFIEAVSNAGHEDCYDKLASMWMDLSHKRWLHCDTALGNGEL